MEYTIDIKHKMVEKEIGDETKELSLQSMMCRQYADEIYHLKKILSKKDIAWAFGMEYQDLIDISNEILGKWSDKLRILTRRRDFVDYITGEPMDWDGLVQWLTHYKSTKHFRKALKNRTVPMKLIKEVFDELERMGINIEEELKDIG